MDKWQCCAVSKDGITKHFGTQHECQVYVRYHPLCEVRERLHGYKKYRVEAVFVGDTVYIFEGGWVDALPFVVDHDYDDLRTYHDQKAMYRWIRGHEIENVVRVKRRHKENSIVSKKRIRTYCIYSGFSGDSITNKFRNSSGRWSIFVRAVSIRQAYYFVGKEVMLDDQLGVFFMNYPGGPSMAGLFQFNNRMRAAVNKGWTKFNRKGRKPIEFKDSWLD